MREDLLDRIMIRHVQFEVRLKFEIFHKILELSLAQFLIEGHFLCLLVDVLLEAGFDGLPELGNQFKHANFKEAIEKVFVALEEGDDEVLGDKVVEGFLTDGAIADLSWLELVSQAVRDLKGSAVESYRNLKIVLEEVMGCVKIELNVLQLVNFSVEVAGEVEVAHFVGVQSVSPLIDGNFDL